MPIEYSCHYVWKVRAQNYNSEAVVSNAPYQHEESDATSWSIEWERCDLLEIEDQTHNVGVEVESYFWRPRVFCTSARRGSNHPARDVFTVFLSTCSFIITLEVRITGHYQRTFLMLQGSLHSYLYEGKCKYNCWWLLSNCGILHVWICDHICPLREFDFKQILAPFLKRQGVGFNN